MAVITRHGPFISRKLRRRMSNVTWKLLGMGMYYGLIMQISIVQSKCVLCRLCKGTLKNIKAPQFWMILGLLSVLFLALNWFLSKVIYRLVVPNDNDTVRISRSYKSGMYLYSPNHIPKYTRSGTVYGYM